ncbi:hypothetical protein QBC39DRAFT_436948 [Podospora conica]|nr:hypothetical protein QBC39DRAFT_436948 [Schizothecium conicum]
MVPEDDSLVPQPDVDAWPDEDDPELPRRNAPAPDLTDDCLFNFALREDAAIQPTRAPDCLVASEGWRSGDCISNVPSLVSSGRPAYVRIADTNGVITATALASSIGRMAPAVEAEPQIIPQPIHVLGNHWALGVIKLKTGRSTPLSTTA